DSRRLIAFLKAMEFSTLIRRVTEFSGTEAAEIEPDERLKTAGASPARPAPPVQTSPASPDGKASKPAPRPPGRDQAAPAPGDMTPQALATARVEAARHRKIDRSRY